MQSRLVLNFAQVESLHLSGEMSPKKAEVTKKRGLNQSPKGVGLKVGCLLHDTRIAMLSLFC